MSDENPKIKTLLREFLYFVAPGGILLLRRFRSSPKARDSRLNRWRSSSLQFPTGRQ
jgi:hypothetical protein